MQNFAIGVRNPVRCINDIPLIAYIIYWMFLFLILIVLLLTYCLNIAHIDIFIAHIDIFIAHMDNFIDPISLDTADAL